MVRPEVSITATTESSPDSTTETDATLPVPADTREYIQVRPAAEPLTADNAESQLRRLHQLTVAADRSLFNVLCRRPGTGPTIECLLYAAGEADAPLQYLFGVDDPDALDALERVLRELLPDAYELDRRQKTPASIAPFSADEDTSLGAVTYHGHPERRQDWQTSLTPFRAVADDADGPGTVPLTTIAEAMAAADVPMLYQALFRPKPDWTGAAEQRHRAITTMGETLGDQFINAIAGRPDEDEISLSASDQTRLDELEQRDTRHSFVVNARLAVAGETRGQTERLARELTTAFADVSHTCYAIEGEIATGDAARDVLTKIRERRVDPPTYDSLTARLPLTSNQSAGIVADAREAPNFCLLDGAALSAAGGRAVSPTPGERTALPRPPGEHLTAYREAGLLLGHPLTQDGTPDDDPLFVPPTLQPLHAAWFGKTGSGKSTSLINAILENHAATDGADILIDPKGDGMAEDYLRAHYATYDTLDDVLYFDCGEVLPALSFFDIREELDAGVPRTTAVEDTVDHYLEILMGIMGRDRFEQAVRSPDVIRYLVKALFDPVNGHDAFTHRDLHDAVQQMHDRQTAPAVADEDLERMLSGVVANRARSFDEIMQGVANRIEKVPADERLARIFNHVPETGDPHFDLADYLDEDVVIIIDTGELRSEAQRVLALVVLSNLWTALRRRVTQDATADSGAGAESAATGERDAKEAPDGDTRPAADADLPLVNLYIEEAASIAVSDLLQEVLAQSRSFGCSVTLSMQFPGQLRRFGDEVYDEVLNNVSTIVTGNVPADRRLARRLATDAMEPQAVENRLRALRRGQWLVSLPAGFDEPEPRPFLIRSATPPPGDPAGDEALSAAKEERFQSQLATVRDRTRADAGLLLAQPSAAGDEDDADADAGDESTQLSTRVDTALPHTNRLPQTVTYDSRLHALRCTECDTRYDPDIDGMERAIECCSSLDAVDRADVPICDLNLKLTPEEREISEWSDRQLMFLQAVYNAQQLRYDTLEYDLLSDSMIRLQEYVGIDSDAVQDLIDAGLLRHDTDHPHRLFTVTPDGRSVIGESYRLGVDYGHGKGDLEESSQHVFAVEVGRRYLIQEYVEDPDSPVTEVIPYYDLDRDETLSAAAFMGSDEAVEEAVDDFEQRRLDVAALDAEGEIVVALEAERVNNDVSRAVPDDFDKIAECDVEEAIWVVMSQSAGHDVLAALNDPADGEPRVEKTYADTTPPQQFRIETPGLTAMYPVGWLRNQLAAEQ